MSRIIRATSSFTRLAVTTQYTAGDEISNHATAGSVVRPTFDFTGFNRGRVLGAGIGIVSDGTIVITALNFDMLLWKTAQVPTAVGNNVTFPLTGLQRTQAVGRFLFDDGGWVNPLGAYAASTSAWQQVPDTMMLPISAPEAVHSDGANFDFTGSAIGSRELTAVMQALAAWNPGNVANTFGAVLDIVAE